MWSDLPSRRAALFGLLALGGCGFAPVHSTNDRLRGLVSFDTANNVDGFRLRAQLERRLGRSEGPAYSLDVTVSVARRAAAITSNRESVRFNLRGTARWILTEIGSGDRIDRGEVQSFTSYSATGSTVATEAASDDARARLMVILADLIVTRLFALSDELAS